MAVKKPIVISNGQLQELQSGDSLSGTVPTGGTTGQVLKKNTDTDGDTGWGPALTGFPRLHVGTTAPDNPTENTLWIDTN